MAIYTVSDLHGQKELWNQIKEYLKPEDTLYCLGDCVDRGPDGFDILIEILNRPNTITLMGNHEKLMLDNYSPRLEVNSFTIYDNLWFMNGGHYTLFNMEAYSQNKVYEVLEQVKRLPYQKIIYNQKGQKLILDHSGYSIRLGQDEPLWNRYHFHETWPKEEEYENTYMIHGHTPTVALFRFRVEGLEKYRKQEISKNPEIIRYCDEHKIDIDLGCFTTNKTCLLDLNTLEPIYFEQEKESEVEYVYE